jgi:uncharacterized membrane protein YqiK
METVIGMGPIAILLWVCIVGVIVVALSGFSYIPHNMVGIVEKVVSRSGSVHTGLLALHGEAGFEPHVLRGGMHYLLPFVYRVHRMPLVTIGQGRIGYVVARDGAPLPATQTLACNEVAQDFEDAERFLRDGGQKGPQRKIIREGTYAINLVQFCVVTHDQIFYLPLNPGEKKLFESMATLISSRMGFSPVVIEGHADLIGIVTVQDGPSVEQGQIIAPTVGDDVEDIATYHNDFQDPECFLRAGGRRGRQLKTLVDGTYYINRLFATVEAVSKTIIDVGTVGVVVSYVGETGQDVSGEAYSHGELVRKHQRGVWSEGLLPGKYAFNTYAGCVVPVPTTNFILKWSRTESGTHRFDENLSEVSLITKDAFEPSLPLSVVVHIDYRKAPLVIQRFGDIKRLVEQTLDPMVSAYFKNVGQTRTLIQLLQDRSAIQQVAREQMRAKFAEYNLELEEVLIGTPTSGKSGGQIDEILTQLRARQIAEEQVATYALKERAAVKERELREAESRAHQQTHITESELSIVVQMNEGKAEYARAQQQAAQMRTLAEAEAARTWILGEGEARRIREVGSAEAERTTKLGIAEAIAIEEQVRAYGGPERKLRETVLTRFATAIETAKVDVVPRVLIGNANGNGGGGGSMLETLLGVMLAERVGNENGADVAPRGAAAEKLRSELLSTL